MRASEALRESYEQQVYAGVLGKVIGVYMGRPFEGWWKPALEEKWGRVDRYVYEDRNVPLVVADDDISGTFTFVRALEDSGLYADTPVEFFGDNWLNYIMEHKTVLWWGGMGHSTEHTAFLRLKQGVRAPRSGSIALNGATVAEQIGAQIFIDAFGLVAPGKPQLAARLARRAASVSHDGEAVHAATIVAGMVSAAFVEKNMRRLLDIGVGLVPPGSLIARVHRDVRAWCAQDKDWRKTYERIDRKYGYHRYGGNCHVVPNHAIMVMAWCCAPDDFHEAQVIINTAGWDTDCNAANVGSVMGVKVGLDRICEKYDFRSPFADRIVLPTAEGTRSASDCLLEALYIARMGRRIMGWPAQPAPKRGAWHHFEMPGALHGYQADGTTIETRGAAQVANVPGRSATGTRSLGVAFDVGPGRVARVATPVLPPESQGSGYQIKGCARLCPGMTLRLRGEAGELDGAATVRLFVRTSNDTGQPPGPRTAGSAVRLRPGRRFSVSLAIPDLAGWPVQEAGFEIVAKARACGELFVDSVDFTGAPQIAFPADLPRKKDGCVTGWISDYDMVRGKFSDDAEAVTHAGKNESRGVMVTGTLDWKDYTFEARIKIHLAEQAGLIVRYQGLQRYLAVIKTGDALRLVRRHYGDHVLAECPCRWKLDSLHAVRVVCQGPRVTVFCDGKRVMEAEDRTFDRGGAGFVFEKGIMGFRDVKVS